MSLCTVDGDDDSDETRRDVAPNHAVDTVSIDNGEMTRDGDGQLDDDGGDARPPANERNAREAEHRRATSTAKLIQQLSSTDDTEYPK
jgi:hypothetical protein